MGLRLTSRPPGRVLAALVLAVAAATVVVVLLPRPGPASLDDRTHAVAAQLKCPTCIGESAADSTSPVAQSMRTEIKRQLREGRDEKQITAWFRA